MFGSVAWLAIGRRLGVGGGRGKGTASRRLDVDTAPLSLCETDAGGRLFLSFAEVS